MKNKITLFLFVTASVVLYCLGCSISGGDVQGPEITITSPESKHYTVLPADIEYSLSEICPSVTVTLNDTELDPVDDLSDSVTGLNTLVISATNEQEGSSTEQVVFFYNDLTVDDSDDFNRADSADIDNEWTEVDFNEILEIKNNRLASTGCDNPDSYPNVTKDYDGSIKTEVLQKIDIVHLTQDTPAQVFLILRDLSDFDEAGDYFEQVQAQLETVRENNTFMGYKLLLTYFGMDYDPQNTYWGSLAASGVLNIAFDNPVTMVYYKNGTNYSAAVYDHNDYIIAYVSTTYIFTDSDGSGFTNYSIQLMPKDSSSNPTYLIQVDNFEYY